VAVWHNVLTQANAVVQAHSDPRTEHVSTNTDSSNGGESAAELAGQCSPALVDSL
jgi:hypothetical protein